MRSRSIVLPAVLVAALFTGAVWAQGTLGMVRGKAIDAKGEPIVGATVEFTHGATNRRITVKTDRRGNFVSLGFPPGTYSARLVKDRKELSRMEGIPVMPGDETEVTFDLAEPAGQPGAAPGAAPGAPAEITPEQRKQLTEGQKKELEKIEKEQKTVRSLNELLGQAAAARQAGNHGEAVELLNRAVQIDDTRDVVWAHLAEANVAVSQFEEGAKAYQRAIALKPAGAYYNNMGQALLKAGRNDDAVQAYTKAAEIDPPNAATYFFNLGAVFTNINQPDEATAAFDKAIAADPKRADAHYWKGVNLLSKATVEGDKMVAPPGTAEAFNKYLELQPKGEYADAAQQLLESIGAKVETQIGRPRRR